MMEMGLTYSSFMAVFMGSNRIEDGWKNICGKNGFLRINIVHVARARGTPKLLVARRFMRTISDQTITSTSVGFISYHSFISQNTYSHTPKRPYSQTMSFLFGGRPQLSSAEKVAQAELEVEMVSDMLNRYRCRSSLPSSMPPPIIIPSLICDRP